MRVARKSGADKRDGVSRTIVGLLSVFMVMPLFGQEAEEDIRGPKALIEIPVPEEPSNGWMYVLGGLLVLLVIGVLVWMFKKNNQPNVTAEELAKKELDRLGRDGGSLEAGDFALAASQVVRVFIERKFGLAAPKRTTEEFLQELASKENRVLSSRMEPLRGFLKSCDMAKFAGADLGVGERGELVAKARAFVEAPAESRKEEAA